MPDWHGFCYGSGRLIGMVFARAAVWHANCCKAIGTVIATRVYIIKVKVTACCVKMTQFLA